EAGWLSWQASSGRGKRGQLLFHKPRKVCATR
ncbi:hypothetical protein CK247_31395, partial [Klebsiella pneumoniae]